jgi:hypothetical protein
MKNVITIATFAALVLSSAQVTSASARKAHGAPVGWTGKAGSDRIWTGKAGVNRFFLSTAGTRSASGRRAHSGQLGGTGTASADCFSRAYQESQGETLGNDF